MNLEPDDRVVSAAKIAREEAEAAHEQAAARKAEEQEQRERDTARQTVKPHHFKPPDESAARTRTGLVWAVYSRIPGPRSRKIFI